MVEQNNITPREHAQLHLAILGERQVYHTTAKNYQTKQIKNEFLPKNDVISVLFNWNGNGFTTWLSINDKETDDINGVTALQDMWFDLDARPKGVDDRPATTEEMQKILNQMIKLKNHIETTYSAIGFAANSGNGFHLHFPLARFEIPKEMRGQVNKKVRAFAKKEANLIGVKIDNTYDISRRTTLIGTYNKKIADHALPTQWQKELFENGFDSALKLVDTARTQNKILLDAILNSEEEKLVEQKLITSKDNHIDIEQLCQINTKFYELYKVANKTNELYKKYGYPSRSEAEQSVLTTLVIEGFSDQEIKQLMQNCSLGKWQEKEESYHNLSIGHARQKANEIVKNVETQNQLIKEISQSSTNPTTTLADDILTTDINPILIAKKIEEKYHFAVEKGTKLLYVYDEKEGIYCGDTETVIKNEMCNLLDNFTKVRFYQDIDNWIRFNSKTVIVEFNTYPNLIAVNNGILDINTTPPTLLEFDPKYYITNKLPHTYNKDATCTPIENFLEVSMPNKNHRMQHQEFLGKIIAKLNHQFHEYGIMQGEGNNGKSVLIDIDTFFLGRKNVGNQTLQALIYDKYSIATLKDKIANFCADLPSTMLKHMGIINMLSSGDPIQSEAKYEDPIFWIPNLGMIFACNEAPAIDPSEDHTGTYRRILIWEFPISFTPNHPDPKYREDKKLRSKLLTEENMSGYLNYAIAGYKRLLEQGEFTGKAPIQEIRKEYIKRSDSPHAFVLDHCQDTDNENDIVSSDDIYRIFIKYCVEKKLTRRSKGQLTKAIRNYVPGAEQTKLKLNPEDRDSPRIWGWRFLKLVNLSDLSDLSNVSRKVKTFLNKKEEQEIEKSSEKIKSIGEYLDNSGISAEENIAVNEAINNDEQQPQNRSNDGKFCGGHGKKQMIIMAEHFIPKPGRFCNYPEPDHMIEAEYRLHGNLYCPTHYEQAKKELQSLGKAVFLKTKNIEEEEYEG